LAVIRGATTIAPTTPAIPTAASIVRFTVDVIRIALFNFDGPG
jgi:hypothetical protein